MKRFTLQLVLPALAIMLIAGSAHSQAPEIPHVDIACIDDPVIVGITSALHTGKIGATGGLWSAHEVCDAEFPTSIMCSIRIRTEVSPPYPTLPATGAWVNGVINNTCSNWSFGGSQVGSNGAVVIPGGTLNAVSCDQLRPLLCCER